MQERPKRQPLVRPSDARYIISGRDVRNGFSYLHTAALSIGDADMRAWELLSDVPRVHNIVSYVVLAMNIIVPGTGTVLAACMSDRNMANKT